MHSKIFDTAKGMHIATVRTICEVHREIYDLLVLGMYEDIVPKLEEAFMMGISLTRKLMEYKLEDFEWAENNDRKAQLLRVERALLSDNLESIKAEIKKKNEASNSLRS